MKGINMEKLKLAGYCNEQKKAKKRNIISTLLASVIAFSLPACTSSGGNTSSVAKDPIGGQGAIEEIIEPPAYWAAAKSLNGLWGYIDTSGQWVIEPVYKNAWNCKIRGYIPS